MDPGGQKSIFGQKIKSSIFDQNWPKNVPWRSQINFWSKNQKLKFSTKNGLWGSKVDFDQKSKLNFSTKIGPKILFRGLKSIFGRKFKNSIFGPKMEPGGQKSIFGQKVKSSIFRRKVAQNIPWRSQIDFWSKNEKLKFSTKNGPWGPKIDF